MKQSKLFETHLLKPDPKQLSPRIIDRIIENVGRRRYHYGSSEVGLDPSPTIKYDGPWRIGGDMKTVLPRTAFYSSNVIYLDHNRAIMNIGDEGLYLDCTLPYEPSEYSHPFAIDALGIELEVDRRDVRSHSDLRSMSYLGTIAVLGTYLGSMSNSLFYGHDSSLHAGIELKSEPRALSTHQRYPWRQILELLSWLGWKSHDIRTCGLHVHVNRDALSTPGWKRVAKFVYSFPRELQRLARRHSRSYACFISFGDLIFNSDIDCRISLAVDNPDTRYRPINFTGSRTVEFRLWRGTLNYDTFMARIELTHAIVKFADNCLTSERSGLYPPSAWDDFCDYVNSNPSYSKASNLIATLEP